MSEICTKGKRNWMLSCNEVTELLSLQRDHIPIGILKKLQMKIHLYMCDMCRSFHSIITLPDKESKMKTNASMPKDMQVRIIDNIKNNFKK